MMRWIINFCFIFSATVLYAQNVDLGNQSFDIEQISKFNIKEYWKNLWTKESLKKNFAIHGGLSLNGIIQQNLLKDSNQTPIAQPYTYTIGANLNVQVFKMQFPFTFTYANKSFNKNLPNPSFSFNRIFIQPKYKEWSAQIGQGVTSTISPYSLNGLPYTGASLEYAGADMQVMVLGGQFMKPVKGDSFTMPSYARYGGGLKVNYSYKQHRFGFNYFFAKDVVKSIPQPTDSNRLVTPKENAVIGLELQLAITKSTQFLGEYAISLMTHNLNENNGKSAWWILKPFSPGMGSSTKAYHAIKAGVQQRIKTWTIGLNYERISPQYQTLGATYFVQDFQNITALVSSSLWKGKLNFNINGGFQNDNLSNDKGNLNWRIVLSGNATLQITEKIVLTASYNNMQSYLFVLNTIDRLQQTDPLAVLDTTNKTLITNQGNLSLNYTIAQDKKATHSIAMNGSFMESGTQENKIIKPGQLSRFFQLNTTYVWAYQPFDMNLNVALNYSQNYAVLNTQILYGPTLLLSKGFFKKALQTFASISANLGYLKNNNLPSQQNNLQQIRFGFTYAFFKQHTLQGNATFQLQNLGMPQQRQVFIGTLGYAWNF